MNDQDDYLKPLSFEDQNSEDELKFGPGNNLNNNTEDFVPLSTSGTNEIKNKDSNFVFFFGVSASGKSVLLSAILYYLSSQAGVLRPKLGTPNTKEAQGLLSDFFENIRQGILPNRTTRHQVTRLDLVFEPNNNSKKVPPIDITFLETAGGDHQDISRGGKYHSSIDNFLNTNIPLNFIIVTSYDTAKNEDTLINEFLDELERKGKNLKSVNVLLVVSKWDLSGRVDVANEEELENFITEFLPRTNSRLNAYQLSKTFFTIGNVENGERGERITMLNLDSAKVISNWLYESIVGYPLDYQGTFWEKIKFNF